MNDGRWPVSSQGGTRPAWAPNGRELFYLDGTNILTSVPVDTTGATFRAGNPVKVFDTAYATPSELRPYDISFDGQRFLVLKHTGPEANTPPPSLVVVKHWVEELKAKLPIRQ